MITPTSHEEKILWDQGYTSVIGVDEVGRGAFAGPVVAAAVIFPPYFVDATQKIADSKLLSPQTREWLVPYITRSAVAFAITEVGLTHINTDGIGKATQRAITNAIAIVGEKIAMDFFVLVDGFPIPGLPDKKQKGIIKGDQKSVSIAAASIIAKVYRDTLMKKLHEADPRYNFFQNKGYGTKKHQEAIKKFGLSPMHRTSFNLTAFLP